MITILATLAAPSMRSDSLGIEWMFENNFEKEYINVNEASAVTPEKFYLAMECYRAGLYRRAADILYEVRRLNLPDGNLDFVAFVLAECYRKLGMHSRALEEYWFTASKFPDSDKRAPALFRILEYASREGAVTFADSIYNIFSSEYRNHPLYNSALYTYGKLYYEGERYNEALQILKNISPQSARYIQSVFLSALCCVQTKDWEEALTLLNKVWSGSSDINIRTEAAIVMGDVYYKLNNIERAVIQYRKVPKKAARYEYALVKIARCLLDAGEFEKSADMGRKFLAQRPQSPYFFDMASILEQALRDMGKEKEANEVGASVHRQIIASRINLEIFEEIDRIDDLIGRWQSKENAAVLAKNETLIQWASEGKKRTEALRNSLKLLLNETEKFSDKQKFSPLPNLAERRYLELLKKKSAYIDDTISVLKNTIDSIVELKDGSDSVVLEKKDSLERRYSELNEQYRALQHEYELIAKECVGSNAAGRRENEELQVKFIDWEFSKYLQRKERLVKIASFLAEKKRNKNNISSEKSIDTVLNEEDLLRLERIVSDERQRLIDHIKISIDIYPKSHYTPAVLFRLAELYWDAAEERFRKRMEEYNRHLLLKADTGKITFPEYDLSEAVSVYRKIISDFPTDRYADDALYYCALALQKQGLEDSAEATMKKLIEEYPLSEYYIEANMFLGKYILDHSKKYGMEGYKFAEESFRNVLFYRDHPQFVQALYHLGWCYYMQDRCDEAIASFRYLIEEVDLDFDPINKESKEIANPLLRSEAIDLIATCFDRDSDAFRMNDFMKSTGNTDYAALVLSRMGELHEEDLDFKGAINIYKRLIESYPLSYYAPQAAARLIKLYENADDQPARIAQCETFFRDYSPGGEWRKHNGSRDSVLLQQVDSMVIAIGLLTADGVYRTADSSGLTEAYREAAKQYRRIVDKYPLHPRAADAAWNLAAILEKIGDKVEAFERFKAFSAYPGIDVKRREKAALNAVSIAQSLLPPDSVAPKGKMDFAGLKTAEAVENYVNNFAEGESFTKVLFVLADLYFNRQLFGKAADIYERLINSAISPEEQSRAMLQLGKCRFGEENWSKAVEIFEILWKKPANDEYKTTALKFLLQSYYFDAKEMMNNARYEEASEAFKKLENRFPGSEYGDIALFNSAEALEKKERWIKACDRYFDLAEKYPQSKLAPDALFNAAVDYEKADKLDRAANTYELLITRYPQSPRAKDALFNVGLCYEKMGKIDLMAAANERYSVLYPEEKDVGALLMRSASYYAKTGAFGKAIDLYRNFIRRFPKEAKTVEAYYMIGKCQLDLGDKLNATMSFEQAERQAAAIVQEGEGAGNCYFAGEAAFQRALLLHNKFKEIKLRLPEAQLKTSLQEKTSLLTAASEAYQRVIKYRSEKMFEAAYRMGMLYRELADDLIDQERPKADPIKAALAENEIMTAASQVLQNSFVPLRKAIEFAAGFDSLTTEQLKWVDSSKKYLGENMLMAGTLLYEGVGAMQNAPVPADIASKPLLNYQYRIKLLETVEPLKIKVLNYFTSLLDSLPKLHLDDSIHILCEIHVSRLNYLIGSAYDKLATEILKSTSDLPRNLSENEREELVFQLEDLVYELQDKALLRLEAARNRLVERKMENSLWFGKILETLARLNPEKYGKAFYTQAVFISDESWITREDSVKNWNTHTPPGEGWVSVSVRNVSKTEIKPHLQDIKRIGGDSTWRRLYIWKNIFCNGKPREGLIAVSAAGKYRLYVNGVLTLSDTIGGADINRCDTARGIAALIKGGDNVIACEGGDSLSAKLGIAFKMEVLLDTTEHFVSSIKPPRVPERRDSVYKSSEEAQSQVVISSVASAEPKPTQMADTPPPAKDKPVATARMSRREVIDAIEKYRKREREALSALRRERLEVQRLKILIAEQENKRRQSASKDDKRNLKSPLPMPLPAK